MDYGNANDPKSNRHLGDEVDLQIVGAGLAGLIAANLALDGGLSVRLFEKQRSVGGRAESADHDGYTLNLGPHALYLEGELHAVLGRLGIEPSGVAPHLKGALGSIGQRVGLLPQGPASLLRTSLLSGRSKRRLLALMARLPRMDPHPLASVTVDEWLDDLTDSPDLRALLFGLVNLSTYNTASDRASADAAIGQLQMALGDGVIYLDRGWQQIVDRLSARLDQQTRFERVTASVTEIGGAGAPDATAGRSGGGGYLCRTADGVYRSVNVVVAVGLPAVADRLLGGVGLADQAGPAVRAAVLDLGLRRAPSVDVFLGLDRGLYLSTHSGSAGMAPDGRTLVTVARYIRPDDETGVDETRALLLRHAEAAGIDADDIVMNRYLHRLTVTGGMPTAATGGLAGRPGVAVPGRPGLFLAGDWVGNRGLLADAGAASAIDAVDAVLSRTGAATAPLAVGTP